jgi:hypothetical protein
MERPLVVKSAKSKSGLVILASLTSDSMSWYQPALSYLMPSWATIERNTSTSLVPAANSTVVFWRNWSSGRIS